MTSTVLALLGLSSIFTRMKVLTSGFVVQDESDEFGHFETENKLHRRWHLLNGSIFLFQLFRALLVAASIKENAEESFGFSESPESSPKPARKLLPFDFLEVDSFARFATANRQLYDPYIALSFAFIFVFALGNNLLFHRCFRRPEIRRLIEQLLVGNVEDFIASNGRVVAGVREVVNSFRRFKPLQGFLQLMAVYRSLWRHGRFPDEDRNCNRRRNASSANDVRFHQTLADFTFLTAQDRLHLVLVEFGFELLLKAISVLLLLAMVAFSLLYGFFLFHTSSMNFFLVALAFVDALVVYYCSWMLVVNGFLNLILMVLFYLLFKANYQRVNRRLEFLRNALNSFSSFSNTLPSSSKQRTPPPSSAYQQFHHLTSMASSVRFEHGTLSALLLSTDRRFWSALFFVFAVANAPPNVYFVTFLYFKASNFFELCSVGLVLGLQSLAVLTFLFPASVCELAHEAAKTTLPVGSLLFCSGSDNVRLRWKYSVFFEQVNNSSTRKIAYTVGSIDAITRSNLVRVRRLGSFLQSKLQRLLIFLFLISLVFLLVHWLLSLYRPSRDKDLAAWM